MRVAFDPLFPPSSPPFFFYLPPLQYTPLSHLFILPFRLYRILFSFLPFLFFQFSFLIPSVLFVCLNYRIIIIQLRFHQRGIIMTSCHRHRQGSILLGVQGFSPTWMRDMDLISGSCLHRSASSACMFCLLKPKLDIDYFIVSMTDLWSPHRTCVSLFRLKKIF